MGLAPKTPRKSIKQAFQAGLLADGHVWIKMLDDRNMMSHTYKGRISRDILTRIRMRLNEELPLAYTFDVFDQKVIAHKPLQDHIAQFGRPFFVAKTS